MATRTLAIMFTDIQGFTARTAGETRAELVTLLDEHDRLLRPVFAHFGGTVVKTIGDAFLVWFESPTDAVVCGVTIQEVLRKHNETAPPELQIKVRVAINIGDVEMREQDLFGEGVNLASRLEGIAEAGEVWFTEAVYLTMNRHEVPTAEVGERTFKGIPHPVRVYKVIPDPKSDPIRKIGERVRFDGGVPVIDGVRPPASALAPLPRRDDSTARPSGRWIRLGLAFVLFAGSVAAVLLLRASERRHTIAAAQSAIAAGDFQKALDLTDPPLTASPSDAELGAIADHAALALLEKHFDDDDDAAATLDWLTRLVDRRPWLAAARARLPELETAAAMEKARKDGTSEGQALEDQLAKYPNDPNVPWIGARILGSEMGVDPSSLLHYYEQAVERGHPATGELRDLCFEELALDPPDSDYVKSARRILAKAFPDATTPWAQKQLDEGGANAVLNALAILDEAKAAPASDPYWSAVREVLSDTKRDQDAAALRADKDPARRRRAATLIRDHLDHDSPDDDAVGAWEKTLVAQLGGGG